MAFGNVLLTVTRVMLLPSRSSPKFLISRGILVRSVSLGTWIVALIIMLMSTLLLLLCPPCVCYPVVLFVASNVEYFRAFVSCDE